MSVCSDTSNEHEVRPVGKRERGFRRVRKIAKSDYLHRHVCLSVRPHGKQLGSHWTDFHEILICDFSRKSVKKIQVSLQPDNSNGKFQFHGAF